MLHCGSHEVRGLKAGAPLMCFKGPGPAGGGVMSRYWRQWYPASVEQSSSGFRAHGGANRPFSQGNAFVPRDRCRQKAVLLLLLRFKDLRQAPTTLLPSGGGSQQRPWVHQRETEQNLICAMARVAGLDHRGRHHRWKDWGAAPPMTCCAEARMWRGRCRSAPVFRSHGAQV